MSRGSRWMGAVALTLAGSVAPGAHAANLELPADGWSSWEVPASEGTPFWCCWSSGHDSIASRQPCNLDRYPNGYGTRRDRATTDAVRVYALMTGGRLERLQVLAAACPIETRTPVHARDAVAPEDSARWLVAQAKSEPLDDSTRDTILEQALAGLAMHRGDFAGRTLATFAHEDPRTEVRKWAVFWLAKAGSADAERAILAAAREDQDPHVREQAVFALSQLPAERATKALIAAAEDQTLPRDERKRAVFWLAQSESDSAQDYLDKLLVGNAR